MKFLQVLAAALFSGVALGDNVVETSFMNEKGVAARKAKLAYWEKQKEMGLMPKKVRSSKKSAVTCSGGSVSIDGESFPCDSIDFESFIALSDARIPTSGGTSAGSDIWGWLSPEGREITLWCVDNGIWFVDTTVADDPLRLGYMSASRGRTGWSDVKVHEDVAYFVKDSGSGSVGIQVFDLTRLVGLGDNPDRSFTADFLYTEHSNSHNVAVNTESGFLYSVGTNTCSGGLHMIDLSNPLQPEFAGCASSDGYTHDAQCVTYDGPDTRYTGREICLAFNEDTLTIWDVTNKGSPVIVSRQGYGTSEYTHQGWFTADMRYVLLDDELDESRGSVTNTITYIVDVENLENPVFVSEFDHGVRSIDHNLYVWGSIHAKGWGGNPALSNPPSDRYAYCANYISGVRVLDISDMADVSTVGFFDVAPDITGNSFNGAWSTYMHPSGVLAVSSIDRGLFILRPQMAFDTPTPPTTPAPTPPPSETPEPTSFPTVSPTADSGCWFFC